MGRRKSKARYSHIAGRAVLLTASSGELNCRVKPGSAHFVRDLALITVGSVVMSLAYDLFLIPYQIVPGGLGGISMIINHFFGTPVGVVIVLLNIPLFIIGIRTMGRGYGLRSLLGLAISSGFIDFFLYIVPVRPATSNPILATIFGGIVLGVGLGLVFRGGGSTGGSDIIGQLIARTSNFSTGTAILIVDAVIISAAGVCFRNIESALYGFVTLYMSTRAIDLVLEGLSYTRAMFIVSDRGPEIAAAITSRMNRGATLLQGIGAYTNESRPMVYCVMARREVGAIRDLVREIAPGAFITITDVYEVLGEGFRPRA